VPTVEIHVTDLPVAALAGSSDRTADAREPCRLSFPLWELGSSTSNPASAPHVRNRAGGAGLTLAVRPGSVPTQRAFDPYNGSSKIGANRPAVRLGAKRITEKY
jgi:hypothetical protein